jgi:Family of unknown function (DUF6760)
VSRVRALVRRRDGFRGGVLGYPLSAIYEEVAFIAYHFHWPAETILNLEHADRQRWVNEISVINERRNAQKNGETDFENESG